MGWGKKANRIGWEIPGDWSLLLSLSTYLYLYLSANAYLCLPFPLQLWCQSCRREVKYIEDRLCVAGEAYCGEEVHAWMMLLAHRKGTRLGGDAFKLQAFGPGRNLALPFPPTFLFALVSQGLSSSSSSSSSAIQLRQLFLSLSLIAWLSTRLPLAPEGTVAETTTTETNCLMNCYLLRIRYHPISTNYSRDGATKSKRRTEKLW